MSLHRVDTTHPYRDHDPGEIFEADLEPDVEARALEHGITRIERSEPAVRPGSYTPPKAGDHRPNPDRPRGGLLIGRGNR